MMNEDLNIFFIMGSKKTWIQQDAREDINFYYIFSILPNMNKGKQEKLYNIKRSWTKDFRGEQDKTSTSRNISDGRVRESSERIFHH